jgi:hypothetical protein
LECGRRAIQLVLKDDSVQPVQRHVKLFGKYNEIQSDQNRLTRDTLGCGPLVGSLSMMVELYVIAVVPLK